MKHFWPSRVVGAAVSGLVVTTATIVFAPVAFAATTLNVTTLADTAATAGPCGNTSTTPPTAMSLREAVCIANNAGGSYVINLKAGTYLLSSGELAIGAKPGQDVTLKGLGSGSTTIDAQGHSRVLNFDPNQVGHIVGSVQGLEVKGGIDSVFGGAGIIAGGGGVVEGDQLTIANAKIAGNATASDPVAPNATSQPGGGVQFVGGVLIITHTILSGNSSGNSPGSAVAYQAQGLGTESFSMNESTVSGNSGTNSVGPSIVNGGAVDLAGPAGTSMSISQSRFADNAMTGSAGPTSGGAVRLQNGTLSVTGSSFTHNSTSGTGSAGGAIEVAGGTATITNNRIVGNTAPTGGGVDQSGGTVAAADNWWGCNAGPGNPGCDATGGTVTTNPRLVLSSSFVGPITSTGSAMISADVSHDSAGVAMGAIEMGLNGVPMLFSNPSPNPATCVPPTVTLSGATATGGCTFAANGASGPGHLSAQVDNQMITIDFEVTNVPSVTITSGPAAGSFLRSRTAAFRFSSSDTSAVFQCRYARIGTVAPAYSACVSGAAKVLPSDGTWTFSVQARSLVGNTSPAATRTWTIDTLSPVTRFVLKPAAVVRSRARTKTVKFVFGANEVATFRCSRDGGAWAVCRATSYFTVPRGRHTLKVYAVDRAGNRDATPISWTWRVTR